MLTMLTMRFLLPLMLVLVACWASDPIFNDVFPQPIEKVESYRLPENAIPIEYKIKLEPIFESENKYKSFTFNGESEITLSFPKKANTITFHAKELEFIDKEIKLTYKNNSTIENKLNSLPSKDTTKDFVTLTFKDTVPENTTATLFLKYTGKLNDQLRGFYRSSYQNEEGKKIWLATTQFQPVSARQAFPCWDEPQIKAKFNIIITLPQIEGYKAISNMPGKTEDGKTTFKTTPKMSTYLVAFVVSNFTARYVNNETFNVWAKPTVEESAKKFALDFGLKILDELKDFTNIGYYEKNGQDMTKMDQIAIPDFSAGAMENWGLVTYRERRLLDIENKTTTEEKQTIATIIAHEFSHQWFGNLVTCSWWDYIWLNEGFATFFQYYISDKVIPKLYDSKTSWRLMEQFVIKNVQASSFVVDATSVTRPLNPKISAQTPTQIQNLFDDIAYKKGASILYMMQRFLSEEFFQEGLKQYLRDHKSKSVNPDNLFKSISSINFKGKTVKNYLPPNVELNKVMDNWINEPGYPVITVKTQSNSVNITQERFFLVKPMKEDNTQWYIPINYVTEESPKKVMPTDEKSLWMIPETSTVLDIELNNTKWILFNKDQTGYYRVNYDNSNWERLADYLNKPYYANISEINRAQLIDDALNLARAGYLAYETALKITLYLSNEIDYIPWYAAVRAFDYLDDVLLDGKNHKTFRAYVVNKIKNFVTEVNYEDWENGTHVDKLAKVLALNTACKYGLKKCKDFVNKKLTEWLDKEEKDDKKNLSADMRNGILCAGLREANEETWKKILKKYNTTKDEDEKADILAGLGCASKKFAEEFLTLTLEENPIVDIFAAMNSICAGNPESFDILIKFINNNIEKIHKADKEDNSLLTAFLINKLSNRVFTREQYVEFSLFINEKLQESQKYKALDSVINKLSWIKTYQEKVEKWIVDNCKECLYESSASSIILTSSLLIVSLLFTRFY